MNHYFFFLLYFLGGISAACAQPSEEVSFELQVAYDTVGLEETITLNYIINNTKLLEEFTPPSFNQAQLVAGPSITQSMSFINGVQTSSSTYTYLIKPQQLGLLFLPAMTVETRAGWLELAERTVVVVAETPKRPSQVPDPMVQRSPFDHPFFQQQGITPHQDLERLQELLELPNESIKPTPKPKKERKTYRI